MNNKKKLILIISIVLVAIILVIGVTYAAFSYSNTGSNQQLILGDIWMNYAESNSLTIEDAMPGSDYTNYFEFTISGKNTYTKKDIWYEIVLTKGDKPDDKDENYRIPDKYIKFKLVSVDSSNQETEIFTDKTYENLSNRRIHVETIPKNTPEVDKTYRLYMTIDDSLEIGNKSSNVFTLDEWEQAFASVKVNVTGDFTEKEIEIEATDASCFTTEETAFYTRNENMTEEELTLCETYFVDEYFDEGSTARTFCEGTGKQFDAVFQDYLNSLEGYSEDDFLYFENNNIVTKEVGIRILNYAESCGSDVVIPSQINGSKVLRLDGFSGKNITSVVIPNGVRAIERYAFMDNSITELTIPSSIVYVNSSAFLSNLISKLTIEEGVKIIGDNAFENNRLSSVTLPNTIEIYYCQSFDYDVIVTSSNDLTCESGSGGDSGNYICHYGECNG